MRHLLKLLSLVPLPVLYPVGWVIYGIVFHVLRWRRDQVANDIALAFPDSTAAERARILRQSYRNLADVVMEALWGFSASAQALARRVSFENTDPIDAAVAARQSVVLLTPHFCNWEWLLLTAGIAFKLPIDAVYKPQRLKGVDEFLRARRARFGGNPIPHQSFMFEVMKRRNDVRAYALVADHTPKHNEEKYWTRCPG